MWRLVVVLAVAACGDSSSMSDMMPAARHFPKRFLWGTATAPYQVEGGLHACDWYQWDTSPANPHPTEHADDGDHSYALYQADTDAAAAMHNNAMRLGIDWSRLFPTAQSFPDHPDAAAVAHYHAVFASLKKAGITPMVTLYHWALPTWEQDLTSLGETSGWLDDTIVDKFGKLAAFAGKEFGGEVDLWLTLNEPTVNLAAGYVEAIHPPMRSIGDPEGVEHMLHAAKNMVYAHVAAYAALHQSDTVDADGDGIAASVGIAFHQRVFLPAPSNDAMQQEANAEAADRIHYINNVAFLEAVTHGNFDYDLDQSLDEPGDKEADPSLAGKLDWIGVNYYGLSYVQALGTAIGPLTGVPSQTNLPTMNPKTDFGWDIYPQGFRMVLDEVVPYGLPIYITENGIADASDGMRARFLLDHLTVLEDATLQGVDVRGYMHWSLVDNFEWAGGFCPRFGLYSVDYSDPQRTRVPRASATLYRTIIDANDVDPALLEKYPSYPPPTKMCSGG